MWKESLLLDFLPLLREICRFLHLKVCKGLDLFSNGTKAEILKTPTKKYLLNESHELSQG